MTIPLLDLGPALAVPLDARPELLAELAPPTHPLALLPVRLETRFFAGATAPARAAGPGVPRPDPHRQPRPPPQRRGGRRRQAVLGAALARRRRRRPAAQRVADARRPLRRRPRGVDRPRPRTDQPRRRADQPARRRRSAPEAAHVPRPRRAGDGGAHAPRAAASRPAGSSPPTSGGAGARRRHGPRHRRRPRRRARSRRRPRPCRRRPRPARHRRGHALDGRLRPRRGGRHGVARPAPGARSSRRRSTCSSWSASATRRRPTARNGSPACSTPTTTPTGWRSSARARRPTTPPRTRRLRQPRPPRRAELRRRVARPGARSRPRHRRRPPRLRPRPRPPPASSRRSGASPARRRATSRSPTRCRRRCGRRPGATTSRSSRPSTTPDATGSATTPVGTCARPGALPTLRCGRQPYGVLPVTSLAGLHRHRRRRRRRQSGCASSSPALRDQVWRPATFGAARIGRSDDADADVVDVLRGGATSTGYAVRRALGPHFLRHLRLFLGEDLDAHRLLRPPAPAHVQPAQPRRRCPARCRSTCSSTRTPARRSACRSCAATPTARSPTSTRCSPATPTPSPRRCPATRCRCCTRCSATPCCASTPRPPPACSPAPDRSLDQLLADAELVDLVPAPAPTADVELAAQPAAAGRHAGAHGRRAPRRTRPTSPPPAVRAARRAPRGDGASSPPPIPPRSSGCCPPVLDATSYRLDAWVTSLATRRLAELRAAQPDRVSCSAATAGSRTSARAAAARSPSCRPTSPGRSRAAAGRPGLHPRPVARPGERGGAAARGPPRPRRRRRQPLRHQAHVGPGAPGRAAVRRRAPGHPARRAARLRRRAAPARRAARRVHRRPAPHRPAARQGRRRRRSPAARSSTGSCCSASGTTTPTPCSPRSRGSTADDPRRSELVPVLAWLDAAVDAAADAVTAEGVYQLARGNLARAATLDDVAGGLAPPPRLEFVRTPRTGTAITHRVAIVLDADAAVDPASGWADTDRSPRAQAEPRLDAWAAAMLGPAVGSRRGRRRARRRRRRRRRAPRARCPTSACRRSTSCGSAATPAPPPSSPSGRTPPPCRRRPAPTPALRLVLEPAADRTSATGATSATCSSWPARCAA